MKLSIFVVRTQQLFFDIRNFVCRGVKWQFFQLFYNKHGTLCFVISVLNNKASNYHSKSYGPSPNFSELGLRLRRLIKAEVRTGRPRSKRYCVVVQRSKADFRSLVAQKREARQTQEASGGGGAL